MKLKVLLNEHLPSGEIKRLNKVVEAELVEDRPLSVTVKLPNGDTIVRKKPHQLYQGE